MRHQMEEPPLNQVKLKLFLELQLIRTLIFRVNYRKFVAKYLGRNASFMSFEEHRMLLKAFS